MKSIYSQSHYESIFSEIFKDESALHEYQVNQIKNAASFWLVRGCSNAGTIYREILDGAELNQELFSKICEFDRSSEIIAETLNKMSTILTSGSSGMPLKYFVDKNWINQHHANWTLAYRYMSNGLLSGYLDPNFQWCMCRPPGGKTDCFDNLLECIPQPNSLSFSKSLGGFFPDVVHGSVTTMIELTEYKEVHKWKPKYVFFTYENVNKWQIEYLKGIWSSANFKIEYASNDGSISGFSCESDNFHLWSNRSFPYTKYSQLCLIDFSNYASCFLGYQNGDEVGVISNGKCGCNIAFPTAKIIGRKSGSIKLKNGVKISAMCPLNSQQLVGVKCIKFIVITDETIECQFVRNADDAINFDGIEKELLNYSFRNVVFSEKFKISDIRSNSDKFRIVEDRRQLI